MPLAIDFPFDVTERLVIRGGADAKVEDNNIVIDGPASHYEQHVAGGRDLVITTLFRATHDAVSVAAVPDHLAALNEMRDSLDVTIEPHQNGIKPWAEGTGAFVIIAGLAVALARRRGAREMP
jgi:hypothetical protein